MNVTVNIEDTQAVQLTALCQQDGKTAEDVVREALNLFFLQQRSSQKVRDPAFGSWSDFPEDGVDFQRRLRSEWD